ncbi:protein tantalus [Battus philenor]|uniref:protein tantalus n=1 Tax=Battus philenor TaxID=42288 RepID=UPI0035CF6AC1
MDSELPIIMASLDIMEVKESDLDASNREESITATTPRVLRKRKPLTVETTKVSNRRVSMQPRKRNVKDSNPKEIEALYLNKKVKSLSQTLETIYEEPKTSLGSDTIVKGKKVKRLLTFQLGSHYTKEKIRKRRAKIKKLLGNKSFLNRKRIPMKVFLQTIECLDLDEVIHTNTETQTIESVNTSSVNA